MNGSGPYDEHKNGANKPRKMKAKRSSDAVSVPVASAEEFSMSANGGDSMDFATDSFLDGRVDPPKSKLRSQAPAAGRPKRACRHPLRLFA